MNCKQIQLSHLQKRFLKTSISARFSTKYYVICVWMFEITYIICECIFSNMVYIKTKERNRLADETLVRFDFKLSIVEIRLALNYFKYQELTFAVGFPGVLKLYRKYTDSHNL
ncbi:general transcription factor II-I repeat domain-containing protein 2-like [Aphis craccivora]|uniref:General transcription factor II-I repeat domain-containing protein 2-like n=1 Tax=Aphis craccivora TaxID=307492 RepID=A0A6G0YD62_APHCR|nr:general transcription factor II-I repeat domain-containing protein 2-like [Aphis craccivora]